MLPNSVSNPLCPFCLSQRTHLWFNKKTDQGEFPIWTCQHCKGGYVYPRPAQDFLDNFYCSLEYRSTVAPSAMQLNWLLADEHRYPNSTEDAKRIVCHLQQHFGLRPGTLFFDAGAGYGFFSFAALQAGFKVQACEPNPSCRAVFSELTGFEADPEMFNPSIAARYAGRFEVFLMSQVLEHITTLDETLKLIHQILKEGGIAVIAVPHFKSFISILQGKKDMFIIPPEHLNFFFKGRPHIVI